MKRLDSLFSELDMDEIDSMEVDPEEAMATPARFSAAGLQSCAENFAAQQCPTAKEMPVLVKKLQEEIPLWEHRWHCQSIALCLAHVENSDKNTNKDIHENISENLNKSNNKNRNKNKKNVTFLVKKR